MLSHIPSISFFVESFPLSPRCYFLSLSPFAALYVQSGKILSSCLHYTKLGGGGEREGGERKATTQKKQKSFPFFFQNALCKRDKNFPLSSLFLNCPMEEKKERKREETLSIFRPPKATDRNLSFGGMRSWSPPGKKATHYPSWMGGD